MVASITTDILIGIGPWWPIYLTTWSITIETVYFILAASVSWKYGFNETTTTQKDKDSKVQLKPSNLIWWTWLLQNLIYGCQYSRVFDNIRGTYDFFPGSLSVLRLFFGLESE
mmetsp:Transcript_27538/g.44368  ORF Transcript_27538/g.44368 Transcript_27538/m.44368 type:complete len:113 (-) Transcript_27538:1094-1432(-)